MEPHRLERATEALREELFELLSYELEDPRVEGVELVDVHPDPNFRQVRVEVRLPDPQSRHQAALDALENAKGFIKRELASRLQLPRVPDLHFDASTLGRPERVQSLLKRIKRGRPRPDPAS
jgi:ribosome-binding factor A